MRGIHQKLLLVTICLFLISGCAHHEKYIKQTDYHESMPELEQYVLAEMGDYIAFEDPCIADESKRISISIVLISEYTYNEELLVEYPLLAVMEDTRVKMNEFLSDNPEYFPAGYYIDVTISVPPDESTISTVRYYELGSWRNFSPNKVYSDLSVVEYYGIVGAENIQYLNGDGIQVVNLVDYPSDRIDDVLLIIDNLPDVDEVYVNSYVADDVISQRPDVNVISVNK